MPLKTDLQAINSSLHVCEGTWHAAFVFSTLQPNTALFEACCNEKIQQFDDSGSDEEVSVCLDSSIILIQKK